MQLTDDGALLRQYVESHSDEAFAELVTRHINLVYSVALRCVGDPQNAEEVAQAVFIILARKAKHLRHEKALSSWLFQTTRLTAGNFLRSESRRHRREQEAYMQSTLNESGSDVWPSIEPLLDTAVAGLNEKDRQAIVLRFYEGRNLREVGSALGASEDAAEKRVTRALARLRKFFTKRGVTLTTTAIAGAALENSVHAAPIGLATTIAATAAKGSTVAASTLTLVKGALKLMAWTKAKTTILAAAVVLLAATTTTVVVSVANHQEREARDTLERMHQKYASLSSYSSSGRTVEEIGGNTLTASFSMRLGRPDLYHIEYEQHAQTFTNKGAAWSDGSGNYFANDMDGKTTKWPIPGPAHGLGSIAGISGGVVAAVPGEFFGIQIPADSTKNRWSWLFDWLKRPDVHIVKEREERVGETDCTVLSFDKEDETTLLWIGKDDSLIHQSEQRVKSKLPEATDDEVAKLQAGFPGALALPIDEMKRRINKGRKEAAATMKPVTVVFSDRPGTPGLKSMTIQPPGFRVMTQVYENIVVNENFSPADFAR